MIDAALMQRVVGVLADIFGVNAADLHPASSPDTVESWDSIRHLDLVIALEQEFAIVFTAQEIEEAVSVEAICRLVEGKVRP